MKRNILILLIITGSFCSCISRTTNESSKLDNGTQTTLSSDTVSYLYKNDSLIQSVKIVFLEGKINFTVETKNTKRNQSSKLKGIANKLVSDNAEMIEDEEGFAYFVDVYQYTQGDCWLYVNIDNEKYDKLSITASQECVQISKMLAPFGSLGLLKKQ